MGKSALTASAPRPRSDARASALRPQRRNGRHCSNGAAWPGATSLSRVARRLDFVLFAPSRCRKPGVRRMSFPRAESLKRFATDFLVFCIKCAVDRPCALPARDKSRDRWQHRRMTPPSLRRAPDHGDVFPAPRPPPGQVAGPPPDSAGNRPRASGCLAVFGGCDPPETKPRVGSYPCNDSSIAAGAQHAGPADHRRNHQSAISGPWTLLRSRSGGGPSRDFAPWRNPSVVPAARRSSFAFTRWKQLRTPIVLLRSRSRGLARSASGFPQPAASHSTAPADHAHPVPRACFSPARAPSSRASPAVFPAPFSAGPFWSASSSSVFWP